MDRSVTIFLAFTALSSAGCGRPQPITGAEAACDVAKMQVTAQRHLPADHVASCEALPEADGPDGYYILALYGHCDEDLCGSTKMGWFAVQKTTGAVFQWDMGDLRLGRPVAGS